MFKLDKSVIAHLRFPFSFFLMPVYFLAISQSDLSDKQAQQNAIFIFLMLHLLVYPASNGYNSYQDQDTGSIGGLKNPPQATKVLFWISLLMDSLALLMSYFIWVDFFIGVAAYIMVSRLYSWRALRLKKYPVIGFLSVVVFQGIVVFLSVLAGINQFSLIEVWDTGWKFPAIASTLMISGVYPLTQIYQHEQDKADGVTTISYVLGYRGTFIFSAIMFLLAGAIFFYYFSHLEFMIFQIFLLPVAIFFMRWMVKVWNDTTEANYENTMKMNIVASTCMNLCFIILSFLDRLI